MTIGQMLSQSGILTLLGMCVVFGFLIILILAMKLLNVIVHGLHLDKDLGKNPDGKNSTATTAPTVNAGAADDTAVIAAIAAAVHEKEQQ